MHCAGCGFDAPADFAFCPRCGRALVTACPGCGFACPPEFAFCPKCGTRARLVAAPLAAAGEAARSTPETPRPPVETGADRRPVTVLFADLSGFTMLGERLDPEEVRTLQGELFEEIASVIKRYDGFVEKFVVGEPQLLFPCYDGLATLHLDLDDVTEAETYMRKA